jgi:hypothetical protein
MLKFLKKFINIEFDLETGKSVQTITSSLQKTVKALEAHATKQVTKSGKKYEQAQRLFDESASHAHEATKAQSVAAKVGALLS